MKILYFVRHAHAEDDAPTDFERSLSDKGKQQAQLVGNFLNASGVLFDVMIASPALRTIQTAEIICSCFDIPRSMIDKAVELYSANAQDYQQLLLKLDESITCAVVVGHNPGISEIVTSLSNQPTGLSKAAVVGLKLEIDSWEMIGQNTATVFLMETPKTISDSKSE